MADKALVNRVLEALEERWDDQSQEALDELVHTQTSSMASNINNAGQVAQVEWLLDQGWSQEQIVKGVVED